MRKIAIVGAGESGVQLALGLQRHGLQVTLISDRSPDQVRSGGVMSSQCVFSAALATEKPLDISSITTADPAAEELQIAAIGMNLLGAAPASWRAPLDSPARSIDQRLKCSLWIESFITKGGDFRVEKVTVSRLEELASNYELVVVSTGKGELGQIFVPDKSKSPYDRPQRALALTYVHGVEADGVPAVRMTINPGIGEFFTFPGVTISGACQMMVFEGVPGGPMDSWAQVNGPASHLEHSLHLLRDHFPAEAAGFQHATLTDDGGVLRGRITPTVRHPVGELPSGRPVFGLGDAIVLNDPLTGQGSNNATLAAQYYEDAIVRRAEDTFDRAWMLHTFDEFWRGWAQWSVTWTNSLLRPLKEHQLNLLAAAQEHPGVAAALANGFDDPRTLFPWWYDAAEAMNFIQLKTSEENSGLDVRDYRNALGQYATGVTVVTTMGTDGKRIGITANSFTSVSVDPPLVLWCPSNRTPSLASFESATHFAINVLAADQHVLSRQFATASDDKFAGVVTHEGLRGIPVIDGAVATFECRTVSRYKAGDHQIYIGEVQRYESTGGDPLVFHGGQYRSTAAYPDL
jgi:flavin reductase (DIM6/NTAB) family NADH-FMN oxidoreductase RutF